MNVIEGKMTQDGIKVGIVVARFNEFITSKLLGGAKDGLVRHDVPEENIDVAWVPGAFEFGVVTTENIEQAIERAGTKAGNKGYDCALGAIEMINLVRQIG